MDRIHEMVKVLEEKSTLEELEKDFKNIIRKTRVVKKVSSDIETGLKKRGTDNCFFFCSIPAEHNYLKQKIAIIVKPDHSEHRRLGAFVQIGPKIFDKHSDKDKPVLDDERVFEKELPPLEKYVKLLLSKMVRIRKKKLKKVKIA